MRRPPIDEERRPAELGAPPTSTRTRPDQSAGRDDRSDSDRHPAALRRRRAASWRLPPLVCGRHDPLDPQALGVVSAAEIASWRAAWKHLHQVGGYDVDVPPAVRAAAARERRRCRCGGAS